MKTKTPLWTSQAAAEATGGTVTCDFTVTGISINTRTLKPGDLFIALVGPNADGHDYVATAFEKGAAAACVSHRPPVFDPDTPLLMVEDTMQALQDLAVAGRAKLPGKMIAVTGSVGKTGTKEALKRVLGDQAKTDASIGSLNNHWGLPLSLARMNGDDVYAVMELGMNHPGELRPLSKLTRPNVCLITTVQAAHTEFFESTEQIADAKAEIFEGAEAGWTAVLNADIKEFSRLQAAAQAQGAAKILTFGEAGDADFGVVSFHLDALGSDVVARTPLGEVAYRIASPGFHWVSNSLAVLACVHAVGADVFKAAESLARLTPPKKRGERFEIQMPSGSFVLIDESYNASPAAMCAAFAVLGAQPTTGQGRRIAVLGDMLELGDDSAKQHRDLGDVLVAAQIDTVYLAGEAMHHLWTALPPSMQGHHALTSKDLSEVVKAAIQPDDVVMVKGSAGINMSHIVEVLRSLETSPRKVED